VFALTLAASFGLAALLSRLRVAGRIL
jgi:hypothetical protein